MQQLTASHPTNANIAVNIRLFAETGAEAQFTVVPVIHQPGNVGRQMNCIPATRVGKTGLLKGRRRIF